VKWIQSKIDTHWLTLPKGVRRVLLALGAGVVVLGVVLATQSQQQSSVSSSDWLATANSYPTKSPSAASSTIQSAGTLHAQIVVQVVGRVVSPGVYTLQLGARVMDAVFAAGGFTKGADQASINLARPLNDGEQILVASLGNESAGSSASASTSSKLVNLNRADASALDSLPGIGPTLAQRIMDYRQANGGFRSVNDLGKVAGIGPSLLAKLQNLVTL
jgi:competence protein ComEA